MISQGGLYSLRVIYIESYKTQWISYKKIIIHAHTRRKEKKENKNMKHYQVSPEKKNTPVIHLLYIVFTKNNLAFAHLDIKTGRSRTRCSERSQRYSHVRYHTNSIVQIFRRIYPTAGPLGPRRG